MDFPAQMAARYRKHILTVLGAGLGGALVLAGGYALMEATFTDRPPVWVVFLPLVGLFLIPVVGAWSTLTNLRCPACGRGVAMQTATNYSLFGAGAKKTCNHCGERIFGVDGTWPRVR